MSAPAHQASDTLGKKLRAARAIKPNMSMRRLASEAGISAMYVSKLERDLVQQPSPRVLQRLSRALGVPYPELMRLAGYRYSSQMEDEDDRAHSSSSSGIDLYGASDPAVLP